MLQGAVRRAGGKSRKKSADKAEAEAARTAKAIRELVKAEDLLEEINDRIKQNGTPKDAADHTE